METRFEELKAWQDDARKDMENRVDQMKEDYEQMCTHLRAMEVSSELFDEVERLCDELERRDREIDRLNDAIDEQQRELDNRQREIDQLRQQLVDVNERLLATKTTRLEAKAQTLEAKATRLATAPQAPSLEILNHFESGSSAQVFNDKINGKITKLLKWNKNNKNNKNNKTNKNLARERKQTRKAYSTTSRQGLTVRCLMATSADAH